jgi:hypothetical protein
LSTKETSLRVALSTWQGNFQHGGVGAKDGGAIPVLPASEVGFGEGAEAGDLKAQDALGELAGLDGEDVGDGAEVALE